MKKLLLAAILLVSGNIFSMVGRGVKVTLLQHGTNTPIEIDNYNLKINRLSRGMTGFPEGAFLVGTDKNGDTIYLTRLDENAPITSRR